MSAVYETITNSIIEQLEQGAAPWVKGWSGSSLPINTVSKKAYRGINRLVLCLSPFGSNEWATYKQWAELGGQVRKGSKGTHIVFFSPIEKKDENGDVTDKFAMLKTFVVFNRDQVDGLPEVQKTVVEFNAHEASERTIANTGAKIVHGGDRACYIPSKDQINLPEKGDFTSPEQYYATAFHELIHWTGADHRQKRDFSGRFGSEAYAFEELVAELGAAFLCADHGISGELRHAGYIQSWIKVLRDDKKALFKAAALAQKAADFINMSEIAQAA